MLELGSAWDHVRESFAPFQCDCCGKWANFACGQVIDEWSDFYAAYTAYIPPRGQNVVIDIRFGPVEDDNPHTRRDEACLKNKKVLVWSKGEAPRELVDAFDHRPNPDELVDFILRANRDLIPSLHPLEEPGASARPHTAHGPGGRGPAASERAGSRDALPVEEEDPDNPMGGGDAKDAADQQ